MQEEIDGEGGMSWLIFFSCFSITNIYLFRNVRGIYFLQIQLVMVVFPTSRDDKYNAVKKYTFVDCPVPSQVCHFIDKFFPVMMIYNWKDSKTDAYFNFQTFQVILSNTLRKKDKLKSVVQKIMFQVNVKLGGVLWAVKIPLVSIFF